MANIQRIRLLLNHNLGFYRDIARGIVEYAQIRSDWTLELVPPGPKVTVARLLEGATGVIGHVDSMKLGDELLASGIPVINTSGVFSEIKLPRVAVSHPVVGELAANYFLDRGYRHFGFVGYADFAFSAQREAGFRQAIEAAGYTLTSYHDTTPRSFSGVPFEPLNRDILPWLSTLESPTAVLTSNDVQGFYFAEICRVGGVIVPGDLAILSVDNDDLLCAVTRPTLSSISLPSHRIGYKAAEQLDLLLQGKTLAPSTLLPPLGVITRETTDILAIHDSDVCKALQFINENVGKIIGVQDVVEVLPIARRMLERKFRHYLNRGVAEEIRRVRIMNAKRLLAETKLPIVKIAEQAGFSCANQLAMVFRSAMGQTPNEYRRQVHNQPPKIDYSFEQFGNGNNTNRETTAPENLAAKKPIRGAKTKSDDDSGRKRKLQ